MICISSDGCSESTQFDNAYCWKHQRERAKSAERTAAELRAERDALQQRVTELTGQLSESLQINNALIARLEITGKSLENANRQLAQIVINSVRSK